MRRIIEKSDGATSFAYVVGETVVLFLLSFLTLYVFSYTTSPLYDIILNFDQGIFETIGRDWADGRLPYVDTWDSKGPIIFFFNMLGYLMGGRTAIFWIEVVNLTLCLYVSLFFMRHYLSRRWAFPTIIILLCSYITVCSGGNQVCDYTLLLSALSVFAFYRWTDRAFGTANLDFTEAGSHHGSLAYDTKNHKLQSSSLKVQSTKLSAFVYGLFFAASLMSRLTNAVWLCVAVFIIFVVLVKNKAWRNLLANIVSFFIGCAVVIVPFTLYFAAHGATDEMWYATLIYNIEYALTSNPGDKVLTVSGFVYTVFYFMPVLGLFLINLLNIAGNPPQRTINFIWLVVSGVTLFWLYHSYANANYTIINIPFVCVAAIEARHAIRRMGVLPRFAVAGLTLVVLAGFANHLRVFRSYFIYNEQTYKHILTGVDPAYKKSFVAYNCEPEIYLAENIQPHYRFFVCQDWAVYNGSSLISKLRETYEKGDAEWILVYDFANCRIRDIIQRRYDLYRTDTANGLMLFRKKVNKKSK